MKTKNIFRAFLTAVFVLGTWAMNAQTKIYVHKSNGSSDEYNIADIDSISFNSRETTNPTISDYTNLILNEVSGEHKFVEIYNAGTEEISLAGVKLERNDGASSWTGTAEDVIPAGAYRLLLFNSFTAGLDANEAYVGWTVGSGISDQQILKVALVDPSGNEFSVFIRGEMPLPAWQATDGVTRDRDHSYSRMSDGAWGYADPTPGAENGAKQGDIVSPGYLTSQVIVNEVSGEHKFVEIYNASANAVSLNGVKLERNDGMSSWTGDVADVIPAGAYRIFLFNSFTAGLDANEAYVGWTVGSGISDQQVLKVALVDLFGNEFSVFIRGDEPLPAWQSTDGVTRDRDHSYSRMQDTTWAYADPTPGAENGEKQGEIVDPGYLTK